MDSTSWESSVNFNDSNIHLTYPRVDSEGVLKTFIQVNNLTPEKNVGVRVTFDNWASHLDYEAEHVHTEGGLDVFKLEDKISPLTSLYYDIAGTIELAGYVEYPTFTSWSKNPEDNGNHKIAFKRLFNVAHQNDAMVYIKDININDMSKEMEVKILVRNITFKKSVGLRMTEDAWTNYTDVPATYKGHFKEDGHYDEFCVVLPMNDNIMDIEFAAYYYPEHINEGYWDDNNSQNYAINSMKIKIE